MNIHEANRIRACLLSEFCANVTFDDDREPLERDGLAQAAE